MDGTSLFLRAPVNKKPKTIEMSRSISCAADVSPCSGAAARGRWARRPRWRRARAPTRSGSRAPPRCAAAPRTCCGSWECAASPSGASSGPSLTTFLLLDHPGQTKNEARAWKSYLSDHEWHTWLIWTSDLWKESCYNTCQTLASAWPQATIRNILRKKQQSLTSHNV